MLDVKYVIIIITIIKITMTLIQFRYPLSHQLHNAFGHITYTLGQSIQDLPFKLLINS